MDPVAKRHLAQAIAREMPRWIVVCGSGLGAGLVDDPNLDLQVSGRIALADLGLPVPAVEGHGKALVFGRVDAVPVIVQTGRLHPYEGHDVGTCVDLLQVSLSMGVQGVILTCAVGALAPHLSSGQIVLLRDQINLFGPTPLVGPRFVDCSRLYAPRWRERMQKIAAAGGESLPEVVYAHARGPQYETPAETEALRRLGGDVVGMSTTYEALAAAEFGVPVVGLGVVTNAAGAEDLSHEDVQRRSDAARGRMAALLRPLLGDPP